MDMQAAIKELQETVVVMAGIQARQAEVLKGHAEWLEENERWMTRHRQAVARHEQMMARHDQMMAEMEDKLNGLIGFVDDMARRPKDDEDR
ncbi:MAG: hypothetical protein ACLQU1_33390 [Bryobacteraceae bacterium]